MITHHYNNIALCLILVTANGNALGLDASQIDRISRGNHVERDRQLTSTLDNFVHNKAGNTGKHKSLRGFAGVGGNEPTEIGSDNAGAALEAKIKRSNRLAGASASVS